jgi:hypothetical protein
MIPTSYLRVYQPLSAFPEAERARWGKDLEIGTKTEHEASRRWLIEPTMQAVDHTLGRPEGAFVRNVDGVVLVCPLRTRLRMLAGLIAFRGMVPDEVADAFVPEDVARRAAAALENVEETYPDVRSYIVHATWHVPLRWFTAFDDSERILTEDSEGLRIRYETPLSSGQARVERALSILERSWIDEDVTRAVRELSEWLTGFPEEGLLELDYGGVGGLFDEDALVDDRTAAEVWECLEALSAGDVARAGQVFAELSESWGELRSQEAVN